MSRYFINHPVFAWVIAIMIVIAGLLSIRSLGVESYPNIAPPQVSVGANYPGASAETVERAVTQIISANLKRSGLFLPIDQAAYIEKVSNVDAQPRFPDWRQINAQALVTGRLQRLRDAAQRLIAAPPWVGAWGRDNAREEKCPRG